MATITRTFVESGNASYKSTWTITISAENQVVSGNFEFQIPTATAKYVYSGKNYGAAVMHLGLYVEEEYVSYSFEKASYSGSPAALYCVSWPSGSTYTLPSSIWGGSRSVNISDVFNSTNKDERTLNVNLSADNWGIKLFSNNNSNPASGTMSNNYQNSSVINFGTIYTITLDAPPTFETSSLSKVPNNLDYYTKLTTVSVTISNSSAKYGGDISSSKLTIGNQSVEGNGNGTLSLTLENPGPFTPMVSVTDSRGQTTTKPLDPITVNPYSIPFFEGDVYRTDEDGKRNDEGHNALLVAKMYYTSTIANLTEPQVYIDDDPIEEVVGASITWYKALKDSGEVNPATEIDGINITWEDVDSEDTVYGLLDGSYSTTGIFSEGRSYQIGLKITDTKGKNSGIITYTLSQAFYTLDFQAGGKEIAFGAPANDDLTNYPNGLFKCNMDMKVLNAGILKSLCDIFYPKGSYYETSLPYAIPSGSQTPTATDLESLGVTWFHPQWAFGGTWELEASGKFHVSAGTGYAVGATGGEATHVLTPSETATKDHSHTMAHTHGMAHTHSHSHLTAGWRAYQAASGSARSVPVGYNNADRSGQFSSDTNAAASSKSTTDASSAANTGGQTAANGTAHENRPPYIAVNRWHRTA